MLGTVLWLLSVQVSAAKEEAHARERDLRVLGQEKAAVAADAVAAAEERLAQALEVRGTVWSDPDTSYCP